MKKEKTNVVSAEIDMNPLLQGRWREYKTINAQGYKTSLDNETGHLLKIEADSTGVIAYKHNGKWSQNFAVTVEFNADKNLWQIVGFLMPRRVNLVTETELQLGTGNYTDDLVSYYRRLEDN